ncbi:protein Nazo [Penaeus vannamei]|nr:protein C19orf12 homolog [Penaeus vannamei]
MSSMRVEVSEVLAWLADLCEQENLQAAVRESVKGGCIAGIATMCGGLLGGPVGLAIGGAMGGAVAAAVSRRKFKSVAYIILNDLSPTQRKTLATTVTKVIPSQFVNAAASQLTPDMKRQIITAVQHFFGNQLNLSVR